MNRYVARDGDRLDTLILGYYGDLSIFEKVLEVNPGLQSVLSTGDVILLPEVEVDRAEEESLALW